MVVNKVGAKVLADTASTLRALEKLCIWADELHMAYAWASSEQGEAEHWCVLDVGKVKRAVIGISFAHTEPAALKALAARAGALRIYGGTSGSGVFHPKVIIGLREDGRAQAMVGSSNFNSGGFGGNTELNVLLRGKVDEEPIRSVIAFLDEQWASGWRLEVTDHKWFAWYEKERKRQPKPPAPGKPSPQYKLLPADLEVDWGGYFKLVQDHHRKLMWNGWRKYVFAQPDGDSYLQEVAACAEAFHSAATFSGMDEDNRKVVAGFGPDSTGYFGSMAGAGIFMSLVNDDPGRIGKYLDRIPLEGPVKPKVLSRYLEIVDEVDGIDLPTATRLLTAKRPDQFVSVNKGSRPGIRRLFGSAPSRPSGYVRLLEQIWSFPWFSVPKPKDKLESKVWAARVALLDALVYVPVRPK
jgi:hypothetical protein